jgi:acetyl esterase/lipase
VADVLVASAEPRHFRDVRYTTTPGVEANLQSLDIYAPPDAKASPVVVYLHGGYWMAGDKRTVGRLPEFFCGAGYVFVSVNYRLAPEARHPAHIQDVAAAVAWVHDYIGEHGGGRAQIFLTGHSAGAHLAALLGTDAKRLGEAGKPLSILRAVIPLDSGAMDLNAVAANDRRSDSPYRSAFGNDPAAWTDASPIAHVASSKGLPPFQIVIAYGPAIESKRRGMASFAEALRRKGTRAEVLDASLFREHQSLMTEFGAADDPVSKAVLEFIESIRKGKAGAGLGSERVLHAEGKSAAEAVRTLEAYRTRTLMRQFDKNGDGKIEGGEMLEQFRPLFGRLDANKDSVVTTEELSAYYQRTQPIAKPPATGAKPPARSAPDTVFKPDDVPIGDAQAAYIDAEFLQAEGLAVFLDSRAEIWIGAIDPATGLFRNASGRDQQVDTGISKWSRYSNGPEWGLDAKGPALFYVKDNAQGAGQLWRAEPPWDKPRLTQLTHDTDIHNWICEPSVNPSAPSTRVIVYHGKPRATGNVDAWLDEDQPGQLKPFTDRMIIARWGYNTNLITFAYRARPGNPEPSQVTLVDTDTGKSRSITGDEGNKVDPWLWNAPEFGGELLLAVNVDSRALVIFRDVKRDGSPWQRIATFRLPSDAPHQTLKSVEPVNGGRGAFGRSYFTVQAGDDKDQDSSIWLFGFSVEGNHLIQRLDDGALTGLPARRLDPESYIGERELFVYYTRVGEGSSQLHRCRTGVSQTPAATMAAPQNDSGATPLARLVFTRDYFPGSRDASGNFMGGTEAMWLAGHDGKLFAAIGYGQDRPGNDPKPGAQILHKDAPHAPWQVDHQFATNCMRVESLISFSFTTDLRGKPLPKPACLLIASPSELTQAGGTSAVFIRNDATGQWQRSEITGGNLGARSFGSHVDKMTGVHHLFAGLNRGGIHRGSYDPSAPGDIRWEARPERTAEAQTGKGRRIYDYSRVLCFAECNGDLYMAARITTAEDEKPVDGGLYRRVDGHQPSWELVYRWTIDKDILQSRFLRGLTAVPDPKGGKHQVLIANFEYPGFITRFDPSRVGANTPRSRVAMRCGFSNNTPVCSLVN